MPVDPGPPSTAPLPVGVGRPIRTVLFAPGEAGTPGAILRSAMQAESARALGLDVRLIPLPAVGPDDIAGIDLLVLWRAAWSEHVAIMVGLVQAAGALVALDLDDLMIDPTLAAGDLIDAIRTNGFDRADTARMFAAMRRTAEAADFCLASTEELADALRMFNPRVTTVPNGFGPPGPVPRPRRATPATAPGMDRSDGFRRIGWTAGTPTHQRDAAEAFAAIATLFAERRELRLVLFRDERGAPLVDLDEFPALAPHADRIEWQPVQPLAELPAAMVRFDVAICPLETGNRFVECKSEWKFVEAALAGVPLIASPTGPFRRAIEHGRNGLLVSGASAWRDALVAVLDDPALGARLARAAGADVAWRHGPERRRTLLASLLRRLEGGAPGRLEAARDCSPLPVPRAIALPPTECLLDEGAGEAMVAVAVTSFNYAALIVAALDSVCAQTLEAVELVVVDDGSVDGSIERIVAWMTAHRERFARLRLERTHRNAGLGPARNAAFAAATAPHVMVLDADNTLLPSCCARLHAHLAEGDHAFAYASVRQIGTDAPMLSALPWDPLRLVGGNYIDAMAMVARWAWSAAGGYYDNPAARGWEDFDLWCRFAELGFGGVWEPEALSVYRAHAGSMTNTVTERADNKRALVRFMETEHPWLRLRMREPKPRDSLPLE